MKASLDNTLIVSEQTRDWRSTVKKYAHLSLALAIALTLGASAASPVEAKTFWDQLRDSAPRSIFDDLRDTAPLQAPPEDIVGE